MPIQSGEDDEEMQFEIEPTVDDMDALNETEAVNSIEVPTKNMKLFYCDRCKQELSFADNVSILRHRKSHN